MTRPKHTHTLSCQRRRINIYVCEKVHEWEALGGAARRRPAESAASAAEPERARPHPSAAGPAPPVREGWLAGWLAREYGLIRTRAAHEFHESDAVFGQF